MKKYLIINTGSASKKFSLFEDDKELFSAHFEYEGDKIISFYKFSNKEEKVEISKKDFDGSLDFLLDKMKSEGIINEKGEISAIGIRIVAPGEYFRENRLIDDEYISNLKKIEEMAPLHINQVIEKINYIKKTFDKTNIFGISDTLFHKTIPKIASIYAIDNEDSKKFNIKKYGYHGISHKSVISKIENKFGSFPSKTVLCHIGGGVSVTAVLNGESVDTSMGFTPMSGAVMATRVGDIDPGAVIFLMKSKSMDLKESEDYFNHKCGLLGIGGNSDMREIIKMMNDGSNDAKNAFDLFVYRIAKEICSHIASLGSISAIVFSGTIGERSYFVRNKILDFLSGLDIQLDTNLNEKETGDRIINKDNSQVKVFVVESDEVGQMAKEMLDFKL